MFSLTGGIEEVCRVFSRALFDMGFKLSAFRVFSLYDRSSQRDSRCLNKSNFTGFNHSRTLFISRAVSAGIRSDIVILSHINLLVVALLIKKISPKTRIIVYAHGTEIWRKISNWKKKFLRSSCELWAVSNFTSQKLQDIHQVDAGQISIVPNCLNPFLIIPESFNKPAELLKRYNLTADQPVLYTLTRLSSHELYKGYDIIIESLAELLTKHPNIQYLLAGHADENEQSRLEKLVNHAGVTDHVIFTGFIPDEELSSHFKLADIFIMPSRKEGFGIVFIEAAACGCKIIAGNQDGSPQALLNGKLGTLVDPGEKDSILKAICDNLNLPRSNEASKTIQNLCLKHFNYEQYLQRVQELLVNK